MQIQISYFYFCGKYNSTTLEGTKQCGYVGSIGIPKIMQQWKNKLHCNNAYVKLDSWDKMQAFYICICNHNDLDLDYLTHNKQNKLVMGFE